VVLMRPILIDGTNKMIEQLCFTEDQLKFENLDNLDILANHQIGNSTPIYVRLEQDKN
jgi:methionyl-tRNA synthetase